MESGGIFKRVKAVVPVMIPLLFRLSEEQMNLNMQWSADAIEAEQAEQNESYENVCKGLCIAHFVNYIFCQHCSCKNFYE